MKIVHIGDTDYGPEAIRAVRSEIIVLRDKALKDSDFKLSVLLTHNIGLLSALADMLEAGLYHEPREPDQERE